MERLIAQFTAALTQGGVRAMAAQPSKLLPRLKAPMTAVGVERVSGLSAAFGHYLGVKDDLQTGDRAVYGRHLEARLYFRIASPVHLGGGRCVQEANRLMDILLWGVDGVEIRAFAMESCAYDPKGDYFTATLTADIRARVYLETADDTQPVLDFRLKGEIQ